MRSGHNIGTIKEDGYLVIPISMARLSTGQTPEKIYEIVNYFAKKLRTYSSDVILLYTSGLYLNVEKLSYNKRTKINEQTLNHSIALRKLIQKRKQYMPKAFHFLPIDYVLLNSKEFSEFFNTLKKLEKKDRKFREAIKKDMGDRKYSRANVNFILEEVTVAHIIRQRLVELPRTLVKNDIWRLIVYSGSYMESDLYQWKKKILPQEDKINPYSGTQYDFSKKKIFIFDQMKLKK